ncbi:unnamed protein product [Phytophthora fragariaefolia]|uniref:Unnamed protein product n=1 Tax=Phytophthora fragariaefolia TaxID=1490495 RepID=A0A9W6Y776_9STRA|nr:unnamed protein product [Phytophthora fragariaefolia]
MNGIQSSLAAVVNNANSMNAIDERPECWDVVYSSEVSALFSLFPPFKYECCALLLLQPLILSRKYDTFLLKCHHLKRNVECNFNAAETNGATSVTPLKQRVDARNGVTYLQGEHYCIDAVYIGVIPRFLVGATSIIGRIKSIMDALSFFAN